MEAYVAYVWEGCGSRHLLKLQDRFVSWSTIPDHSMNVLGHSEKRRAAKDLVRILVLEHYKSHSPYF